MSNSRSPIQSVSIQVITKSDDRAAEVRFVYHYNQNVMDFWWLVDFNYNFECDWLIELSVNKLSDNNLANELVENRSFLSHHCGGNCNFLWLGKLFDFDAKVLASNPLNLR